MQEVLVNCLFKLAKEKVWLGELTIAVDLRRKATEQTNIYFQVTWEPVGPLTQSIDLV